MKVNRCWIWIIVLVGWWSGVWADEEPTLPARVDTIKKTIFLDYRNFYSLRNLGMLGTGLGVGAIFANTSLDSDIRTRYQEDARGQTTDNFSKAIRDLGADAVIVPTFAGVALIGEFAEDSRLGSVAGEWGRRSLRAFIVGAPSAFFLQYALGGARPTEGSSDWGLFDENNSVSGHSFNGAIPFLTAAGMVDNPYAKWSLYLASPLVGLTRINDDKHYFSQVALGWWMAYLAVDSVEKTEAKKKVVSVLPIAVENAIGVMVNVRF